MSSININIKEILNMSLTNIVDVKPVGHHELGRNYVYQIEDDRGSQYILKIYGIKSRWCKEVTALKILKEVVYCPEIIDKGILTDGTEWILIRKIPGVVLDEIWSTLSERNKEIIIYTMGEYLGVIHDKYTYDYFGCWKECRESKIHYKNFLEYRRRNDMKIFNDIKKQNLPDIDILSRAYNKLISYYDRIEDDMKPRLCHRDFSGRNIIVSKVGDTWRVSGLIDFEHSRPDDPNIDIAPLYDRIFYMDPSLKEMFLKGYKKHMDISSKFDDKIEYYLLNSGLNICSWAYELAPSYYIEGLSLLKRLIKVD